VIKLDLKKKKKKKTLTRENERKKLIKMEKNILKKN
jgi:hypothetical protein